MATLEARTCISNEYVSLYKLRRIRWSLAVVGSHT